MADPKKTAVLIYNIGHHDVFLYQRTGRTPVSYRRKGGSYREYTQKVLEALERAQFNLDNEPEQRGFAFPAGSEVGDLFQGFKWTRDDVDLSKLDGVWFPVLLPTVTEWLKKRSGEDMILLLVSSDPVDKTLSSSGSAVAARILQEFVQRRWQGITVELLPSITEDLFSFDVMPKYIRTFVLDRLARIRREVLNSCKEKDEAWQKNMRVDLSVSTGTDAMVASLLMGLAEYKPGFVHIPRARAEPNFDRLFRVEVFNYSTIEQVPAQEFLDGKALPVVNEMIEWRNEFKKVLAMNSGAPFFWHKKSKKHVLAVLNYELDGCQKYIRSCNLEVSLPTGTLCAERNAIGTALAQEPRLLPEHFKRVAVLSLPNTDEEDTMNPLAPCGACMEWLRKIAEKNPDFEVITFSDESCTKGFRRPVI